MMKAATKRVRASRALVMVMRVVGNKEGKGGKGHGIGEEGDMQRRGKWQQRQDDGNTGDGGGDGNNVGNGNGNNVGG
jgi:hypothetical protein